MPWQDDVLDGENLSAQALARVRAAPGFSAAMRRLASGACEICRQDRMVFRIHKDTSHFVLAVLALYLHASGGFTLGRLQKLCVDARLCSAGRAVAILVQLRLMGFVNPLPRQDDGRLRAFAPTPHLAAALRARMRNDLVAAALVDPEITDLLPHFDDETVFLAFMKRFGEGLIDAARVREDRHPSLAIFSHHAVGLLALYAIMLTAEPADTFPPSGQVQISLSALAQAFGVSRTHIRRVLRSAEAAGYLRRDPETNLGWLEASLREELELYFSILFTGLGIAAREAAPAISRAAA